MKILSEKQIREADRYTIEHEPIASIELMERASAAITDYLADKYPDRPPFIFWVGKGNNGGDGLAAARLLSKKGFGCTVYTLFPEEEATEEYRINLRRLPEEVELMRFDPEQPFLPPPGAVVVDALLGTGTRPPAKGIPAAAIERINSCGREIVSIDIPSGLSPEPGIPEKPVVKADITLTLQFPKLSLLLPDSGVYAGKMVVLPIGLHEKYIAEASSPYYFTTADEVRKLLKKRPVFAHKGMYGHALLIAGSRGMTGAAILAAGGALRSGCGLVTVHTPETERAALHCARPAAMINPDKGSCFTEVPGDLDKYSAVGTGCGLGQAPETVSAFAELMRRYRRPMVIDADALNLLAAHRELLPMVPENSILTPHPGELRRLIGPWKDDREKLEKTSALAASIRCYIVIKGAYSVVCSPQGLYRFNSTGNPGMAKGGSGDVLTGLMTGLLAKGMDPQSAAVLAVYAHGHAGEKAAHIHGIESMNAEDIAEKINLNG